MTITPISQIPMSPQFLFSFGQVVATPGALTLLKSQGCEAIAFLTRHRTGDWGDLDEEDKDANNAALKSGARLLSVYAIADSRLWVMTDATSDDGRRASTCLLLPEEY